MPYDSVPEYPGLALLTDSTTELAFTFPVSSLSVHNSQHVLCFASYILRQPLVDLGSDLRLDCFTLLWRQVCWPRLTSDAKPFLQFTGLVALAPIYSFGPCLASLGMASRASPSRVSQHVCVYTTILYHSDINADAMLPLLLHSALPYLLFPPTPQIVQQSWVKYGTV